MSVVERIIHHDRDDVYAALAAPQTYPEWLVGARRILRVDPEFPRQGTGFVHQVGIGLAHLSDRTSVEAVRSGHELVLRAKARPFLVALVRFELFDDAPGSTLVRVSEEPTGPYRLGQPLMEPLITKRNERSLERLESFLDLTGAAATRTATTDARGVRR